MIPWMGFYPDADEHTAGVITDCEMMLPGMRGYYGAPSAIAQTTALAGECRGSVIVTKLDNTTRIFAGTQTHLYEQNAGAWTDVTSATTYTGSAESVWRFAQFGNVSLAVNLVDPTQKSVSTGAFSALAGAPKGAVIDTVGGFVFIGNYDDGTSTPDGVFWSAYQDYTDWTPDVGTQCGNLRLLDTAGEIRALRRLGQFAVAYKQNSMYLGANAGAPLLWGFTLVSGEIGAVSQEAVVNIETAHYFVGNNDFYMFDGSRPVSIGDGIREWFFNDVNNQFLYKTRGLHDKQNALIYWFYVPSGGSSLTSCVIYNYKTNKWGRANRSVDACLEYLSGAITYSSLESSYATYTDIPSVTYGSPFWTASSPTVAVFGTDHILYTLTGSSVSSSITTGAIGDDVQMSMLSRVQPRFTNDPTTGSMTNWYRMTDGSSFTQDQTVSMSRGRFDITRAARWHKIKTSYTGDVEVIGNSYVVVPEGFE